MEEKVEIEGLDALIKALQIFRKYGNPRKPVHCEHDTFYVCGINSAVVSDEDKEALDKLGFFISGDDDFFMSYRFGSA